VNQPIKLLLLEDFPDDMFLIKKTLAKAGLQAVIDHHDTGEGFRYSVENFKPDLIIADIYVPGYGGFTAHNFVERHAPGTPFIFLTGQIAKSDREGNRFPDNAEVVLKGQLHSLPDVVRNCLRNKKPA